MKTLLLFLLTGVGLTSKAQSYQYVPFPSDSGEYWQYEVVQVNFPYPPLVYTNWLTIAGDTVIDGTSYRHAFNDQSFGGGLQAGHYYMREDSLKRIFIRGNFYYYWNNGANSGYRYFTIDSGDILLYQFGMNKGDTIPVTWDAKTFVIDSIDTVNIGGRLRLRYLMKTSGTFLYHPEYWIEGLGSMRGPFAYTVFEFEGEQCLRSVYDDSLIIVNDCFDWLDVTEHNQNKLIVSPNPFSNQLTFALSDNEQTTVSIYNLFGQQVLQQAFTNSTTLNTEQLTSGIYFYELRNHTGVIKSGKVLRE